MYKTYKPVDIWKTFLLLILFFAYLPAVCRTYLQQGRDSVVRQNLVLRNSVTHAPPRFWDIECWVQRRFVYLQDVYYSISKMKFKTSNFKT